MSPPRPQVSPADIAPTELVAYLIERYQTRVWRYLRTMGCDPALADDLTQDTFVAVLRRPPEIFNDAATDGYLRRVAYHLMIDHRRRAKRMVVCERVAEAESLWVRWIGCESEAEPMRLLRSCFERLTPRAKTSLRMRYHDHASREDIAAALEISPDGAKNLMQRAKNQMRECIQTRMAPETP